MATAMQLQKFTDFDRLFKWKNFIITLIGSLAAFAASYYSEAIIDTSEFGPPFGLSLTFGIILIVSVYTRNIASAGIVGIVGAIGIVSPYGGSVDFALSYILISLSFAIVTALLANRLLLVMSWIKFHLSIAIVFSIFLMGLSIAADPEVDEYTTRGYNVEDGGDIGIAINVSVMELIIFASLLILTLIVYFILRKPMILDSESVFKYEVFGSLFLLFGQALAFVTLLGLTDTVRQSDMNAIARKPLHLRTIGDLLSHQTEGDFYAFVIAPLTVYSILSIVTVLTAIGVSFLYIAKHKGNIEGIRGGSDIAYLATPIGLIIFNIGGYYFLQNLMYEGGFFISVEMIPVITTMIWAVFFFNQIFARIILAILDKILPQSN